MLALSYALIVTLVLIAGGPTRAVADETTGGNEPNAANSLLEAVRFATDRFFDPSAAEAEGYYLQFGCVSGPDTGAMGLHYVNLVLTDGVLDVERPEIIMYEQVPSGTRSRTGAAYLALADDWNARHSGPPQLMGQVFHYFESPNHLGLPAYYALYVWAWEENPLGVFSNWNPNVSCVPFSGQG